MPGADLLRLEGISKSYAASRWAGRAGLRRALHRTEMELAAGASIGVVGESGSGKTTLARIATALLTPTSGRVLFGGNDITALPERRLRGIRRRFQVIFQDPYASLNPRMRVVDTVQEPLRYHRIVPAGHEREEAEKVLGSVGMDIGLAERYPHELSGGQRQRVAIARSLVMQPDLLVADEPVASLDVSIQAQILNLLKEERKRRGCALMFISHDLRLVAYMCEELTVLYAGHVVERGRTADVYGAPAHPYTANMLDSIPRLGMARSADAAESVTGEGELPENGCPFAPRCPQARAECLLAAVRLREVSPGHETACILAG